jgi:hypothetical protein
MSNQSSNTQSPDGEESAAQPSGTADPPSTHTINKSLPPSLTATDLLRMAIAQMKSSDDEETLEQPSEAANSSSANTANKALPSTLSASELLRIALIAKKKPQDGEESLAHPTPSVDSEQLDGVTTNTPKGRLTVSILEAKGLNHCKYPYVLCQFQRSEYISKGAKSGPYRKKSHGLQINSAPRSTRINDSRRSVQRSVQVPVQGIEDLEEMNNPRWEHEATLYEYVKLLVIG